MLEYIADHGMEIMSGHRRQSGNVLFLILIAVALFAALAFVIMQSNRGTAKGTASDQDTLEAAQILQYASEVRQAVTRLRIINNCQLTEFDFTNPVWQDINNNPVMSANPNARIPACSLFKPGGAYLPALTFKVSVAAFDSFKGGHGMFFWHPFYRVGTDLPDLLLFIVGLDVSVCKAINKGLGHGEIYPNQPQDNSTLGSYAGDEPGLDPTAIPVGEPASIQGDSVCMDPSFFPGAANNTIAAFTIIPR
jgi:hypothetical protein